MMITWIENLSIVASCRKNLDPFEVPECEAEDVFVFEMNCIGRGLNFLSSLTICHFCSGVFMCFSNPKLVWL